MKREMKARRADRIWPGVSDGEPPVGALHTNRAPKGRQRDSRRSSCASLSPLRGSGSFVDRVPGVPFGHPRLNSAGPSGLRRGMRNSTNPAGSRLVVESISCSLHNFKPAGRLCGQFLHGFTRACGGSEARHTAANRHQAPAGGGAHLEVSARASQRPARADAPILRQPLVRRLRATWECYGVLQPGRHRRENG